MAVFPLLAEYFMLRSALDRPFSLPSFQSSGFSRALLTFRHHTSDVWIKDLEFKDLDLSVIYLSGIQSLLLKTSLGGLLFLSKLFQWVTPHNNSQAKEQSLIQVKSVPIQVSESLIILTAEILGWELVNKSQWLLASCSCQSLIFFTCPFNISENVYAVTVLDNSLVSLDLRTFNILFWFFFPGTSLFLWNNSFDLVILLWEEEQEHLLLCEQKTCSK